LKNWNEIEIPESQKRYLICLQNVIFAEKVPITTDTTGMIASPQSIKFRVENIPTTKNQSNLAILRTSSTQAAQPIIREKWCSQTIMC
jgi:hypothetical protein